MAFVRLSLISVLLLVPMLRVAAGGQPQQPPQPEQAAAQAESLGVSDAEGNEWAFRRATEAIGLRFTVNTSLDALVLDAQPDLLRRAPGFQEGRWPDTADRFWRRTIDEYWRSPET